MDSIAGVSTCTVSKVMNNIGTGYSEKTAQKVRKVAASLNYIPSSSAKTLREAKSYTIGLIVPNINNDFFASLALFIEKEMRIKGYSVFIANGAGNVDIEKQYFRVLVSKSVDGIISCSNLNFLVDSCRENGIPLVNVVRYPKNAPIPVVAIDNHAGAKMAVSHLIARGCQHILFLGYSTADENRIAREKGYICALKEHGIDVDKKYILHCHLAKDRPSVAGMALEKFLYSGHPLDGIFAANDSIAISALTYLMKKGFRIPDDIKIVGFDNSIYSNLTYPGISTIDTHIEQLAKESCRIMQDMIQKESVPHKIFYVPFDLIERDSTAITST